jgi:hypothetical protein
VHYVHDLAVAQPPVAFTAHVPPQEELSFQGARVLVGDRKDREGRGAFSCRLAYDLGPGVHAFGICTKFRDDLPVRSPAASAGTTLLVRVPCGDVVGLAADTVNVAEIAASLVHWVQLHPPQESRQLDDSRVCVRQRTPAVSFDEIAGENNLRPFPVQSLACRLVGHTGTIIDSSAPRCGMHRGGGPSGEQLVDRVHDGGAADPGL